MQGLQHHDLPGTMDRGYRKGCCLSGKGIYTEKAFDISKENILGHHHHSFGPCIESDYTGVLS